MHRRCNSRFLCMLYTSTLCKHTRVYMRGRHKPGINGRIYQYRSDKLIRTWCRWFMNGRMVCVNNIILYHHVRVKVVFHQKKHFKRFFLSSYTTWVSVLDFKSFHWFTRKNKNKKKAFVFIVQKHEQYELYTLC